MSDIEPLQQIGQQLDVIDLDGQPETIPDPAFESKLAEFTDLNEISFRQVLGTEYCKFLLNPHCSIVPAPQTSRNVVSIYRNNIESMLRGWDNAALEKASQNNQNTDTVREVARDILSAR